jgi:hypothetical protein
VPYLSFTIGAHVSIRGGGYDDETKFSASLGGGVRLPFNDRACRRRSAHAAT